VWDHVTEPRGRIDAPIGRSTKDPTKMAVVIGGREARTGYEVVRRYDEPVEATELVCSLETGRTHQIRVHMAHEGHPLLGDETYGKGFRTKAVKLPAPAQPVLEALGRQALHAAVLGFEHPSTGEHLRFESPLPADIARLVAALG
jgi:23S rRNA pseudouridine1911/1915/1917 synthase